MDATRLRFLASAVLLLATFLWTNCADAKPPQAPPVRKCFCPSCDCFTCFCKTGECRCAGCSVKKSGDSFNSGDAVKADLPLEIVLFTAEEWCIPCQSLAPHWEKVAAENKGICRTVDISDPESPGDVLAKEYGIDRFPCLVRLVNGRVERTSLVGGLNLEGLRATVERWKR